MIANWITKMKAGMRLMMEACEESEKENGTCTCSSDFRGDRGTRPGGRRYDQRDHDLRRRGQQRAELQRQCGCMGRGERK